MVTRGALAPPPPLQAFLTAAHELRSPLAWLLGEVESLKELSHGPLNAAQAKLVCQISATCVRMQRIVEDCFSYGRLENGDLAFHAEVADVDALMLELASAWAPAFAKKDVRLKAGSQGRVEPFACDAHKLLRVVSILLENALKFTPRGGQVELLWQPCVWMRGGGESQPREANACCISVRDTGAGIAPENQQEIFEPFVSLNRGDVAPVASVAPGNRHRRRRDDSAPGLGLGLGLAVARRLVQWHGGKIWVESELHRGSTFSLMLPLRPLG
ncbi:MAG: sensor histidine kinase [Terriglobales bacterium]